MTKEDQNLLRALKAQGCSSRVIAARLNCSQQTVLKYARRMGESFESPHGHPSVQVRLRADARDDLQAIAEAQGLAGTAEAFALLASRPAVRRAIERAKVGRTK